jgi:hypothetical protein
MKHVVQENDDGCGIACVAMLAKLHYWEARLKVLGRRDLTSHITSEEQIRRGLKRCDLKMGSRQRFPKNKWRKGTGDYKFNAMLRIQPRKKSKYWHWVVWDGKDTLDPLPRNDRYKNPLSYCRSYFEISKIASR